MSVIVTGASGQFGRVAAEQLLRRIPGEQIILTTRTPDAISEFAQRGAQVRFADFDDPDSLRTAFAGGTKMLLISTSRVGSRTGPHGAAIDAAVEAGVNHIAYTSFINTEAEGNPSLVAQEHLLTEKLVKDSNVAYTFLRDSQYADAVADAMAPRALRMGYFQSSSDGGRVAFVARDDCAECAAVILTSAGHENVAYDITGPDLVSYREVAELIAEYGGSPVEYQEVTDEDMYANFDAAGVPRRPIEGLVADHIPWCSDDMVTFEMAIRGGFLAMTSDHVQQLLGRQPLSLRHVLASRYPKQN